MLAVAALASLEWVDHYSVKAAVALLMVVLAFLTALWPRGRRYLAYR
jgi:hypothetical protein